MRMRFIKAFLMLMLVSAPAASAGEATPPATQPAAARANATPRPVTVPVPTPNDTGDLRELIGVNPTGLQRVEMPHMPAMSMRGFVQPHGGEPMALLEIKDLNRSFLVKAGTEIPVMVSGRVAPIGQAELTGLANPGKAPVAPNPAADAQQQSQIILQVVKVTNEGVTVKAGLMAQTIIIR